MGNDDQESTTVYFQDGVTNVVHGEELCSVRLFR